MQMLIDVYRIDSTVKAKVHIAMYINVTGHVQKSTMSMLIMPSCIFISLKKENQQTCYEFLNNFF